MEGLLVRFLAYGKENLGYSIYTIKGYRSDIRAFYRWLAAHGVTEPDAITRGHIERYDVEHASADKRPGTRRRKIAAIRAFANWLLHEAHAIAANPALKLKLPPADTALRTAPTPAEKAALFDGATRLESRYTGALATMLLAVMFYAGLRPMEAIALELDDLDMQKRLLVVKRGKGRKRREVPINDILAAHVALWLPQRLPARLGTPFLVSPQHRAVTYYLLRTTFVKVKIAGGLRAATYLTAHCLRHWFATRLYANRVDVMVIMKLMGHASLTTTQIYCHQMGNELADAVRGIDAETPKPAPSVLKGAEAVPARRAAAFRRTG